MDKRILSPEIQDFISTNEGKDLYSISLGTKAVAGVPVKTIIEQIKAKAIAERKASILLKAGIYYPPSISMEQSSSDATAMYKQSLLSGDHLTDLTGGAGLDTIYLAQNHIDAIYIDQNEDLCEVFQYNIGILDISNIEVIHDTAEKFIANQSSLGNIYIDPSRRDDSSRFNRFENCEPNIFEIFPILMELADQILIKGSPMLPVYESLRSFQVPLDIHFVSIKNELKEILFLWNKDMKQNRFHCVNLETKQDMVSWSVSEEEASTIELHHPMEYIYEPNASVMKAGGYKYIGSKYNLKKLAANTHLYTSDKLISFPGRRFKLKGIISTSDLKKIPKANVAVRNFPLTVDQIKKKYKILDGGDNYLYGCTLINDKKAFLQLTRISS